MLLLRSPGGAGIGVSLAALPFEATAIARGYVPRRPPGDRAAEERGLDWNYGETHVAAQAALKEDPAMPGKLRRIRDAAKRR